MRPLKKSLRAKFTLVLLLVGVLPLAGAAVFFYLTSRDALFRNVFKELRWNVDEIAATIEGHFSQTSKDLLLASNNIAFKMYFLDPANKRRWLDEQQKALRQLRGIYKEMLDEACYIDSKGNEIARIVLDEMAHESELSSEEERASFFKSSFEVDEGQVFQGRPTISEDTKRWVMPNATPITVAGKKAGILHFEISMGYFQKLLKDSINPERGYGFIINDKGEFLAHTLMDIKEDSPFPSAITADAPAGLLNIYKKILEGASDIEQFTLRNKDYYISFRPINTAPLRGVNENRWAIAYVLPSDKVYVEASLLRYNLAVAGLTLLAVVVAASLVGNYVTRPIRALAEAAHKVAAGEMPKIDVKSADEIGELSGSFNIMIEAIRRRDEALKALALRDGLTGLYNHRHFKAELEREIKSAVRFARPLSLIMMDVDHFKRYNDSHGHTYGDAALQKIGEVLNKATREVDLAARYGGEEFAVILPETALENALTVAERIRKRMEEEPIQFKETQPEGALTLSLGVAAMNESLRDSQSLIEAADKALYKAKELGRNRVHPEKNRAL